MPYLLTGNYTFFNWLAIVLCFSLLDEGDTVAGTCRWQDDKMDARIRIFDHLGQRVGCSTGARAGRGSERPASA